MAATRNPLFLRVVEGPQRGEVVEAKSTSLSIGRTKRNKLFLDDEGVAKSHATISWTSRRWVLSDKEDSTGTFVNGNKLQSGDEIELTNGDILKFGQNSVIEVEIVRSEIGKFDNPIQSTLNHQKCTDEPNEPHTKTYSKSSIIVFHGISGPCKDVFFDSMLDQITIGRAKGNIFKISDDSVSEKHALVEWRDDNQWYLTDRGSTNGTYLNDRQIDCNTPVKLTDEDEISFGEFSIIRINLLKVSQFENSTVEDFYRAIKDLAIKNANNDCDKVVNNLRAEFDLLKKKLTNQYGHS